FGSSHSASTFGSVSARQTRSGGCGNTTSISTLALIRLLLLHPVESAGQRSDAAAPEVRVTRRPHMDVLDGLGRQPIDSLPPLPADLHQAGFSQYAHM